MTSNFLNYSGLTHEYLSLDLLVEGRTRKICANLSLA